MPEKTGAPLFVTICFLRINLGQAKSGQMTE